MGVVDRSAEVKTITQTGGPPWAVDIFDGLRAANGGKLGGFFDVFAWREPGEVRFDEVKVGRDPIGPISAGSSSWRWMFITSWTSSRSSRFLVGLFLPE